MSEMRRRKSAADLYHVVIRGSGRQLIFEDDEDRRYFLGMLSHNLREHNCSIIAWCLMGNHVHLLLRIKLEGLASFMRDTQASYARYFNKRHERVGHLFQGRYRSEPINDDQYLVTVVRYIHENPARAGCATVSGYRWSSYANYLGSPGICDTDLVLEVLGGARAFEGVHRGLHASTPLLTEDGLVRNMADDRARRVAAEVLGEGKLRGLSALGKAERDEALAALLARGFTVRQLERISGVGRGIILRVSRRANVRDM